MSESANHQFDLDDDLPSPRSRERPKQLSVFKELLYLLLKIGAIALAFVLMFTFMFGLTRYADSSMDPALKDGDLVMFYRLDKQYVARDTLLLEVEGKLQVRRVVATAGDVVDITEDGLLINGARQQESEIYQKTQRYAQGV